MNTMQAVVRTSVIARLISLAALISPAAWAQCPMSFASPLSSPVGSDYCIAIGDLNADGRPDLVSARGGVAVLLGNGDGTFAAGGSYATGYENLTVAIGDVNADGLLDVAVPNTLQNNVSVLLGNGDGSLAAAVNYATGNQSPLSLAIGDLNSDGRADLAVSRQVGVSVLLGNANGTFAAPVISAASETNLWSVAIGDLNGDRKPDLALAGNIDVLVLLGNGDGTFAQAVHYPVGSFPRSVAIGDLNGDGRPDLAVANLFSYNVSVLLGNGDGSFAAQTTYGTGEYSWSVAIGDLNGDGRPDLAVANKGYSTVSVLRNNGNGTFAPAANYGTGQNSGPTSVAIDDLNADGRPDLAVANGQYGTLAVLLNTGPSIGFNPQPESQSFEPGANVVLTATATGTGPFTYQWRRNGVQITGATAAVLTINNATSASAGIYDVRVSGGCNPFTFATSYPAVLSITSNCPSDIDRDGQIGLTDLALLLTVFGSTCP